MTVSILNFDDVYARQSFYREIDYEWLDLSQIRNVNGYCAPDALAAIRNKLKDRRQRGITFIGSGNYHYVTYLLLAELPVPFTLVLFDYHTDLVPAMSGSSLLSCGSWVLRSLEDLPLLCRVVMIGVNPELVVTLSGMYGTKVRIFSADQVRLGEGFLDQLFSSIPTDTVYLSLDKDVLSPAEAATDWEQGKMTLAEVLSLLGEIGSRKRVLGLDVCGEYSFSASAEFLPETREAIDKNNRANRVILELALNLVAGGKNAAA